MWKHIRRPPALKAGILLMLLLVAAYLFGFVGRHVALPHTPYVFVIQPGVSDQSVALVRTGLERADQFLLHATGRTITEQTTVRVASFTPCSPLKPIPRFAATAEVVANRLCVNTRSGVWQEALSGNPGIARSVIAHEHYHVFQHQLGCLPSPWHKQYEWLIEGSASYVGWQTAIASGDLDRAWVMMLLTRMRTSARLSPLASYERGIDGDAAYSLAYQAVQQLVSRTGSLASMTDFCERVGHGEPWHDAFARSFGITLDDFYRRFEASR